MATAPPPIRWIPATYPDQFTGTAGARCRNSLTEIDAKGNVVPDLAESFEPSDGAKKWVFKLRKGATFHNGKTVTADDVVASIRHHMGQDSKSAAKSLLEPVTDIKADGPTTVIFELSGGNADFPYIVSATITSRSCRRRTTARSTGQSGIRTGPYILEKFEPGVIATIKRNPNYFKSDKGWFDAVECSSITDVTARTNALNSGEIALHGSLRSEDARHAEAQSDS